MSRRNNRVVMLLATALQNRRCHAGEVLLVKPPSRSSSCFLFACRLHIIGRPSLGMDVPMVWFFVLSCLSSSFQH